MVRANQNDADRYADDNKRNGDDCCPPQCQSMALLSGSLSLRLKPGRARASQAHSFPWAEPITARGGKDYEAVKMVRPIQRTLAVRLHS